jgi:CheY-like chemotaxis protein
VRRVAELLRGFGYHVITAARGRDIIPLAAMHRPELIVLDTEFSDTSGRDLLQAIKRDPRMASVDVLSWSISGRDSEHYLAPADSALLLPKIATVLLRRSS